MLRDLISNLSLLITTYFIIGRIYRYRLASMQPDLPRTKLLIGLLFGLQGLLLMALSLNPAPSVIIDVRHLAIVISGLFAGPAAALLAGGIIAAGRFLMFQHDLLSLKAAAGMLLAGIACALLFYVRAGVVLRFTLMNATSLVIISLNIYRNMQSKPLALEAIGYHWLISGLGGYIALFVASYVYKTNYAMHQLALREERYRGLMIGSPEAIVVHAGGIVRLINDKGLELFGVSAKEEVLGKPLSEFVGSLHSQPAQEHTTADADPGSLFSGQDKLIRPGGTVLDVEFSATPITYKNEAAVMAIFRDITHRKQTELKLQEALQTLKRLSHLDGLTGVANRRYFDEQLAEAWTEAAERSERISLIMFDVDAFKAYNDTYGHQAGDECLKSIASAVDEMLKGSGRILARYGGEEFAVILPDTGGEMAEAVAEGIRRKVEGLQIPHHVSPVSPCVTTSLGVATVLPALTPEPKELIRMADKALYKAKEDGRNRVSAASSSQED